MVKEQLPNLYLVTDRHQTNGRPLIEVVRTALEGGIRIVQLREKDLSGRELFNLAKELRGLTDKYNAKLLINDRVDIALAVGADGVHLGRQSVSVRDARRAFETSSLPGIVPIPPTPSSSPYQGGVSVNQGQSPLIVGVSTHSLEKALQAQSDGADYITFGPLYFTPSKAIYGEPVGIDKLKEVATAVKIPIYALGGIKRENVRGVLNAGIYGVAMISAIISAENVKREAKDILKITASHRQPTTSYQS